MSESTSPRTTLRFDRRVRLECGRVHASGSQQPPSGHRAKYVGIL